MFYSFNFLVNNNNEMLFLIQYNTLFIFVNFMSLINKEMEIQI